MDGSKRLQIGKVSIIRLNPKVTSKIEYLYNDTSIEKYEVPLLSHISYIKIHMYVCFYTGNRFIVPSLNIWYLLPMYVCIHKKTMTDTFTKFRQKSKIFVSEEKFASRVSLDVRPA